MGPSNPHGVIAGNLRKEQIYESLFFFAIFMNLCSLLQLTLAKDNLKMS